MVRQQDSTEPLDEARLLGEKDASMEVEKDDSPKEPDGDVNKQAGQNSSGRPQRSFSPRRTMPKTRRGFRGGRNQHYQNQQSNANRSVYQRPYRDNRTHRSHESRRAVQMERTHVIQAIVTSAVRAAFEATARWEC